MQYAFIRRFGSALLLGTMLAIAPAAGQDSVFRFVSSADLPTLDPTQTTTNVVTDYAFLVFDTLFAMDSKHVPQPQMVDTYTVSDDRLTYTFTLRNGLKWHDGTDVKAEDCVKSLERYFAKDSVGGQLGAKLASLKAIDEKTFVLTLKGPYGLVLENLAKHAPIVPFMYPSRIIAGGHDVPIKEIVGSGPYKFDAGAWRPGSKIVLRKNTDYLARSEPRDLMAGSRKPGSDVVEINIMPDTQTALSAFLAGDVDLLTVVGPEMLPVLKADDTIVTKTRDPAGSTILLRFNMLTPPFNNPLARKAFAMVVDQSQYLAVVSTGPEDGKPCKSIFTCDSPYTTFAGSEIIGNGDIETAKRLVVESGYDGTPIVVLQPTDLPDLSTMALIAAQQLRSIGFNVELAASDWASLVQRRALKVPQTEGGWNLFVATTRAVNMENPATNLPGNTNCEKSWAGWPCDAAAEEIKQKFAAAANMEERKALAEDFQKRIFDLMTFVPAGQFVVYSAWRKNVNDVAIGAAGPLYSVNVSR